MAITQNRRSTGDKRKDAIIGLVHQILQRRFSDNIIKQQIDSSDAKKINFACPICGDSQKKASKKRGNIFFKSSTYKCFNDGCMEFMSIRKFISLFVRKYNLTPDLTVFDEPIQIKRANSTNTLVRFLLSDKEKIVSITTLINRFDLRRVDELTEDSAVFRELERRCITHTEDYGDLIYSDSSDNKFYIFNMDLKSGKIIGFAIRKLDPDVSIKYIIKTYDDILKACNVLGIDNNTIDDCNELGNYFNVLNLDFSKPITIAEGQLDSMFINNCFSTTGVSKAMNILESIGEKKNIRILFDRDKGGKKEMIKLINSGYKVFLWNKLIQDLKKKWKSEEDNKDIHNIKDINDLYIFFNKRKSADLDSFNELINKYFSSSVYDIVFI